jgi:hypothetical protein
MRNADFVVKVANPYFSVHCKHKEPPENLREATACAVKEKVFPLFYEGCLKHHFELPDESRFLMEKYRRRREKQIEAAKLLTDIQEKYGVELMFFKTFHPFKYVPDDVDLLLRDENNLNFLIEILKERGFFVHNVGTPEMGMRKLEGGSYVDLDIHKRLAVGSLEIFDAENLWRSHAYETFELEDGYAVRTLSGDYEVVREAAYSLLKDFKLSIAGLYLAVNAMKNRDLATVKKIAAEQNLKVPLQLYLHVAYRAACQLFGAEAKKTLLYEENGDVPFPNNVCGNITVPYQFPIPAIVFSYLSKAALEVERNKNLGVIGQVIKQPASKGISVLLDYARELFENLAV